MSEEDDIEDLKLSSRYEKSWMRVEELEQAIEDGNGLGQEILTSLCFGLRIISWEALGSVLCISNFISNLAIER